MSFSSSRITLNRSIRCSGFGTKNNKLININFKPASNTSGIRFIRKDLNNAIVLAEWQNISNSILNSSLEYQGVNIMFVEHLMAALWSLNISDVDIEIDGDEVPLFDGSAYYFVSLLKIAGFKSLKEKSKKLFIEKEIKVVGNSDDVFIIAMPNKNDFSVNFNIEFSVKSIGVQFFNFSAMKDSFFDRSYLARTFCSFDEFSERQNIFSDGWNLHNHVLYKNDSFNSSDSILRYKYEAVSHKCLDFIGDMNLIPYNVYGEFFASKSGHSLTHKLIKTIFSNKDHYSILEEN